jgi:hypothetical protein
VGVQKFSSNVVEKCLQMASVDLQETLIRELCSEDTIGHMLHDQYGNTCCLLLTTVHHSLSPQLFPT